MDLRQLTYFLNVLEAGSFTRAAETLHMAQPALSQQVQKLEDGLLVQGRLHLVLECQCVRCLKPFQYHLTLDDWTCHLPLSGEDCAVAVNDYVDLTPYVREDILLEFPRHPVCTPECRGLPKTSIGKAINASGTGKTDMGSPAWAELNKLKL